MTDGDSVDIRKPESPQMSFRMQEPEFALVVRVSNLGFGLVCSWASLSLQLQHALEVREWDNITKLLTIYWNVAYES